MVSISTHILDFVKDQPASGARVPKMVVGDGLKYSLYRGS